MARFVTLLRFTDQGARAMGKSAGRALTFKKAAEKAGITVETQLWTMGSYDGLLVLNGDEKKVLRVLTELAELGNVRTETMPAFAIDEFKGMTS